MLAMIENQDPPRSSWAASECVGMNDMDEQLEKKSGEGKNTSGHGMNQESNKRKMAMSNWT
jgi:hypothetical protein